MKKLLSLTSLALFMMTSFVCFYAMAGDEVLAPQDFFEQIMQAIQAFGGLSTMLKISTVVMLIVSSMKVTFLRDLVWSRLGAAQAWIAPLLGLIAGVLGLGIGDQPITLASIMAYVAAGGGAVILHELLDSMKSIPGIGQVYVTMIDVVQSVLGGKSRDQAK
jgi:uncharacterized membrane protein YbaN (DUF454 family)